MNKKQKLLIIISATLHFAVAALCPAIDNLLALVPGEPDYMITIFLASPLISTGLTLLIAGFRGFWRDNHRSLRIPLCLLIINCICHVVLAPLLGWEFMMWLAIMLFTAYFWIPYFCGLIMIYIIRRSFNKWSDPAEIETDKTTEKTE